MVLSCNQPKVNCARCKTNKARLNTEWTILKGNMAFFVFSLKIRKILSNSEAANPFEMDKHLITQRIHLRSRGSKNFIHVHENLLCPFFCQSAVSGIIDDAVTSASCLFFCFQKSYWIFGSTVASTKSLKKTMLLWAVIRSVPYMGRWV